jgi:hypothetical protein
VLYQAELHSADRATYSQKRAPRQYTRLGQQFTERQVQISMEPPLTPGLPENRTCEPSSKRCLARPLPQPGRTVEFLGRRCFRRPLADGQVAPYVLGPCYNINYRISAANPDPASEIPLSDDSVKSHQAFDIE